MSSFNVLIGLAIGVVAMFVLVIPSVKASVSVDYNNLKKEYSQTTNKKDALHIPHNFHWSMPDWPLRCCHTCCLRLWSLRKL